jgi:hypothetical protein
MLILFGVIVILGLLFMGAWAVGKILGDDPLDELETAVEASLARKSTPAPTAVPPTPKA